MLSTQQTGTIASAFVGAGPVVAHIGRDGCGSAATLVVRDVATQAVSWTASLGSAHAEQPIIAGGKIFVVAGGGLFTFDAAGCGAATCSPIWSNTTTGFEGRPAAGTTGQVLVEHTAGVSGPSNVQA